MKFRTEKDSFGDINISDDKLWGPQTERSLRNFRIGEKMPLELIYAVVNVKKAAAKANSALGALDAQTAEAISNACDEILSGNADEMFPLVIFQTGSGTQTNMNVNEVISHLCARRGVKAHANDTVNMSQSTNDVFPTAIHIACVKLLRENVLPVLSALVGTLKLLTQKYGDLLKTGRTHLQDAVPVTLGNELNAYATLTENGISMLRDALKYLYVLPIGGTAVGNGLNAPAGFDAAAVKYISEMTGEPFVPASDKFAGLSSKDAVLNMHGALSTLASNLLKIASDLRFLSCGPNTGIGEINLPANEPGSSIMPGKVNPTQCEALIMVCCEIFGNHQTLTAACALGQLELNACMPVIAFKSIESLKLLSQAVDSFDKNCVSGLTPNETKMKENLDKNLMLATALSPFIGYDKAAEVVKTAAEKKLSLKQTVEKLGYMTKDEYDAALTQAAKKVK